MSGTLFRPMVPLSIFQFCPPDRLFSLQLLELECLSTVELIRSWDLSNTIQNRKVEFNRQMYLLSC